MVKAVAIGVAVVAMLGAMINGLFEEDLDPADYPACMKIVKHMGTSPDALCADGDDVIKMRSYPLWDSYHPVG